MANNANSQSRKKTVWDQIPYICSVIIAIGAIAGLIASFRGEEVAKSPTPTPSIDIDHSSEGAEAKAETGDININNEVSNSAPQKEEVTTEIKPALPEPNSNIKSSPTPVSGTTERLITNPPTINPVQPPATIAQTELREEQEPVRIHQSIGDNNTNPTIVNGDNNEVRGSEGEREINVDGTYIEKPEGGSTFCTGEANACGSSPSATFNMEDTE